MVLDVETDFSTPYNGMPYVPQNYDRQFHGPDAPAPSAGQQLQRARRAGDQLGRRGQGDSHRPHLGITSLDQGQRLRPVADAGRRRSVTLLDMVYAYSVMDNMGVMVGQPRPEAEQFDWATARWTRC
jgi:membrane carboxypeptidase/penicillin-binding protein